MRSLTRILVSCVALTAIVPVLSGCAGIVVAGAGAGALMLTDRRLSEVYLADEGIEIRSEKRIGEKFGDKVHVNVTSFNRSVLLTGEVPDAETKDGIEKLVLSSSEIK